MQQTLRPYVTTGIALAGATLIAVAPTAPQFPDIRPQQRYQPDIKLSADGADILAPYADLFTNTADNLQDLGSAGFDFPVLTQLLTNPEESLEHLSDVVDMLTNLSPDISTDFGSLPGQISADLPPLLMFAISELGPVINVLNAIDEIAAQVFDFDDPANAFAGLVDAPAILLNAYLNGTDSFDVLGVSIPAFNGILVPAQSSETELEAGELLDILGLGDQSLSDLLDQIGLATRRSSSWPPACSTRWSSATKARSSCSISLAWPASRPRMWRRRCSKPWGWATRPLATSPIRSASAMSRSPIWPTMCSTRSAWVTRPSASSSRTSAWTCRRRSWPKNCSTPCRSATRRSPTWSTRSASAS
jgi:hypothetical protein